MQTPTRLIDRLAPGLILAAALALMPLFGLLPWIGQLDRLSYDFVLRVHTPPALPSNIVIVSIDENSQQVLGALPWPRSVHAELLKKLKEGGARLAVFDVLFDQPSEDPKEDTAFAEGIASFGKVILGKDISTASDPRFSMQIPIEPMEVFYQAGATAGFVTTPVDPDSRIRKAPLIYSEGRTLATEAVFKLTGQQVSAEAGRFLVGQQQVPVIDGWEPPSFLVNYVGPARTIPTQSYYQVREGTIPAGFLKDKVVFIGYDLAAQNTTGGPDIDRFPTPVDNETLMPGVEIHANALNTLLTRSFLRQSSTPVLWLHLIVFGLLITLFTTYMKPLWAGLVTIATGIGGAVGCILVFDRLHYWVSPVYPIALIATIYIANTVVQYRLALRERAQIQKAFKHYVSVEVLDELMKNPEKLELGGVEVEATVLFSDIAGFSKISEKITPHELTTMLNEYFEKLASLIMEEKGMVNKFIGDAVMAIWGAPLENPQHARLCCRAALKMHRAMVEMDPVRCRIGINTGKMIAGNMGSRERFEYTVIGDTVNLSSRLEGVNKAYGTDIIISEMTEERVRGGFLVRNVDSIRVVGKERPVRIYQLLDTAENEGAPEHERWQEMIESFGPAMEAYRLRQWETATRLFERHCVAFPEDPVGKIYLARCRNFLAAPPVEDWDGVYQMETK